jgi:hypothetical protein
MVWCPQRSAPTRRHLTRKSAEDEAARLASNNHGLPFFVLKVVGGVIANPPKLRRIKTVGEFDPDFQIPF